MAAGPGHNAEQVTFRCIEGGHTFCELRDERAPLVLRQSAWCADHDSPAVGTGTPAPAPTTGSA